MKMFLSCRPRCAPPMQDSSLEALLQAKGEWKGTCVAPNCHPHYPDKTGCTNLLGSWANYSVSEKLV